MKRTKQSKLLAVLLAAVIIFSMLPTTAFAADIDSQAAELCTVTEGCTLASNHAGDCVTEESTTVACTKTDDCTGDTHAKGCPLYVAPEKPEEAIGDVCAVAALQERINALPSVEALAEMDEDEQAGIYAEVYAIYDAICELSDEEAGALDVSMLETVVAFFTQQSMPLDSQNTEISVTNTYNGITVDSAIVADGIATIKVLYTETNTMAGIGYSYSVDGETVTGRAIAQQIDSNGTPQTDKTNITGYIRDCSVYTFEVPDGAENISITVDGCTIWTFSDSTLTISGTGAMADFAYTTIDDTKENVNERGIMTFPWADYQQKITNVVVEDGIIRLGNQSFRKFTNLTTLTVNSDDLTEIGTALCMNDSALETVDLTACTNLQSIESGAFTHMSNDAEITIKMTAMVPGLWKPENNYSYGVVTFEYTDQSNLITADNWKAVILSDGDTPTCELIEYTGSADEIEIPAFLTADDKTFTVVSLAYGLFQEKPSITKISFAEGTAVTAIPHCFISIDSASNSQLSSVVLPSSIKTIGTSAFAAYSNSLETFQIGEDSSCVDLTGLTEIDSLGLANLRTSKISGMDLKVSDELKSIGLNAFRNGTFNKMILTKGDYQNIAVADGAFTLFKLTNGLEMENGVENADAIIDGLLAIKMVTTFTQLYENGGKVIYTVDYTANTVNIEVDGVDEFESPEKWHGLPVTQTNITIEKTPWTITATTSANGENTCTITGYSPEKGASTEVKIPKEIDGYTVKAIGENVFKDNSTITKITFAKDSACESIGAYAFAVDSTTSSDNLTSITLPSSLKIIGDYAFYNRTKISTFPELPDGLTTIGNGAFYNVRSGSTDALVIPASVTSIGNFAFRWCYRIKSVVVKSETLALGKQAFMLTRDTSGNYGKYIDFSAVTSLNLAKETDSNGNTLGLGQNSIVYVANDEIAELLNDKTNHPYTYNREKTSIVVINGGTVGNNPTGLSSVTRTDYTAVWYIDSDYTTKVSDTDPLVAGTTYYAEWAKKIGESTNYTVNAIPDQTYTGTAIEPAVIVKNGDTVLKEGYTVTYSNNTNVGTAKATVTLGTDSTEVEFQITKDTKTAIEMADVSVTYGAAYTMTATAKTSAGNAITNGTIIIKYYTDENCTAGETDTAPTNVGTYYAKAVLTETNNYAGASKVAKITISNADFSVSAQGYDGVYDGSEHTITVTAADAVITYSTDGTNYSSTNPSFTDAGTYTVYYKATKANYNDVTGSVDVTISKAEQTISFASATLTAHINAATATNTLNHTVGNGTVTYSSSNKKVATVDENGQVTIKGVGETTITATAAEAKNYNSATATYTLTVSEHNYGEYVSNDDATCTTDGTKTATCTYDGCTVTDTVTDTGSAKGHTWGGWVTITSCTEKGVKYRTCSVCKLSETEGIDPTGHDWDDDYTIDKEATCTTDGSKSIHCKNCDAVKDSTVIPATGKPTDTKPSDNNNFSGNTDSLSTSNSSPKAGDNSNLTFWIILLAVSIGGLGTLLLAWKKQTYREK